MREEFWKSQKKCFILFCFLPCLRFILLIALCAELDVLNSFRCRERWPIDMVVHPRLWLPVIWIPFQHILCSWSWRKLKYSSLMIREKWPVVFMCHRKYWVDWAHFCGFKSIIWQAPYYSWSTPDIFQKKEHPMFPMEDNKSIRAHLNWQEGAAKICTKFVLLPIF